MLGPPVVLLLPSLWIPRGDAETSAPPGPMPMWWTAPNPMVLAVKNANSRTPPLEVEVHITRLVLRGESGCPNTTELGARSWYAGMRSLSACLVASAFVWRSDRGGPKCSPVGVTWLFQPPRPTTIRKHVNIQEYLEDVNNLKHQRSTGHYSWVCIVAIEEPSRFRLRTHRSFSASHDAASPFGTHGARPGDLQGCDLRVTESGMVTSAKDLQYLLPKSCNHERHNSLCVSLSSGWSSSQTTCNAQRYPFQCGSLNLGWSSSLMSCNPERHQARCGSLNLGSSSLPKSCNHERHDLQCRSRSVGWTSSPRDLQL